MRDSDLLHPEHKNRTWTYIFDLENPLKPILKGVECNKPGGHNLLKWLVKLCDAMQAGFPTASRLLKSLSTFKGVAKDRFFLIKLKMIDLYFYKDDLRPIINRK